MRKEKRTNAKLKDKKSALIPFTLMLLLVVVPMLVNVLQVFCLLLMFVIPLSDRNDIDKFTVTNGPAKTSLLLLAMYLTLVNPLK